MGVVDIVEMQREHRDWIRANFPETAVAGMNQQLDVDGLLGMVEEVGELAHAVLKYEQGVRVRTAGEFIEQASDALGDIFIYMLSFANSNGFDLDECIANAWQQVRSRDWQANPTNGVDA